MLDALKRLISGKPPEPEWPEVAAWAKGRQLSFKRVRDGGGGFVLDGTFDGKPWRLEWGPPQRQYIEGHEMRLRMDLGLSSNLQMLALTQPLFETLEGNAFESFTESTQTVIDGSTPEEMRWLVMYPKAVVNGSKGLRSRFHFTGGSPAETISWVEGPLGQALESASNGLLLRQPPFVLMTLRGRVYLRMQLPEPDVIAIGTAVTLFQTAVTQALRVSTEVKAEPAPPDEDWAHSQSTAWQTLGTDDPPRKT